MATEKIKWEDASPDFDASEFVMTVYGLTDSGKTTLSGTAPGPIALMHGAEKIEVIKPFYKKIGPHGNGKGGIYNFGGSYRGTTKQITDKASAAVGMLETAIYEAKKWARTVIIDKETDVWELIQLADLGSLTLEGRTDEDIKKGQLAYATTNNIWRSIVKGFDGSGCNLVLISSVHEEYKPFKDPQTGREKKRATGKMVRHGHKKSAEWSDIVLRTSCQQVIEDGISKSEFSVKIEKPWTNSEVRDMELFGSTGDMLNIPTIMSIITGTDVDRWS